MQRQDYQMVFNSHFKIGNVRPRVHPLRKHLYEVWTGQASLRLEVGEWRPWATEPLGLSPILVPVCWAVSWVGCLKGHVSHTCNPVMTPGEVCVWGSLVMGFYHTVESLEAIPLSFVLLYLASDDTTNECSLSVFSVLLTYSFLLQSLSYKIFCLEILMFFFTFWFRKKH